MSDSPDIPKRSALVRFIIAEPTVLVFVFVNVLAVFLSGFEEFPKSLTTFFRTIDCICVCYFVVEAVLKIHVSGFRGYWAQVWNRFDLLIVIASVPLLMEGPESDLGVSAIVARNLASNSSICGSVYCFAGAEFNPGDGREYFVWQTVA